MNIMPARYCLAAACLVSLLWTVGCGQAPATGTTAQPAAPVTNPASDTADEPALASQAVYVDDNAPGAVTTVAGKDKAPPVEDKKSDEKKKVKFDYGTFFEGWPKPKLAVVISGLQNGYLEPCGCAGLENQKGGLSRRFTFIKELEDKGWPVAAVDVGGLVRRFGKQAEIQFGVAADALKSMGYGAVGFGPADLRLSTGEIVAAIAGPQPNDSIFVSANVNLFGLTPKYRIIEAGGMKVGVTSILGKEYQQQVNNAEVEITPAAEALKGVVDKLKDCQVRILLAQATDEECKELAKQFPTFQLIVAGEATGEPPAQPKAIPGSKSRLIEVGEKGMFVIVAGFFDDPKQQVRFQRVALDSRYSDSKEMKELMRAYQDQLQQRGWDDLGVKAVLHPRGQKAAKADKDAGKFASAESCKECHPTAWKIWSKTKHAHATETLTKLDPPRQYDAECISCHSTGWNPSEFFPYVSGFDSLEKTPQLAGNSCENCHGPGAAHVAAEKATKINATKREAERQAMRLSLATAQENVCSKCHDHDNSPDFNSETFMKYWQKVEHKGKR